MRSFLISEKLKYLRDREDKRRNNAYAYFFCHFFFISCERKELYASFSNTHGDQCQRGGDERVMERSIREQMTTIIIFLGLIVLAKSQLIYPDQYEYTKTSIYPAYANNQRRSYSADVAYAASAVPAAPMVYYASSAAPMVYSAPVAAPVAYSAPVAAPVAYSAPVATPVAYSAPAPAVAAPVAYSAPAPAPAQQQHPWNIMHQEQHL
ncbi:vitelline membrane protein Vm26Ab-like isoform X2 [Vespula pensylvanica]|uniref:vitelline membrane protein Vm26Ab-like isoform X2 n=1 Tax=Vespula pensylvanica TaxID=30213 RepID=UPI001CBA3E09|nr:vitelline membrane protein Vm26Ab-like isoform X2 [Vespula pensylvanica]